MHRYVCERFILVECINFIIEKHQMKNSMNNVPTFGNKTKANAIIKLQPITSNAHHSVGRYWKCLCHDRKSSLDCVHFYGHSGGRGDMSTVHGQRKITWALWSFLFIWFCCFGFLLLLLLYLIWCAGLKTLFFFKTDSSFGTANVIDFIVAIIHQVSMYLYSYKNANMYSCLIWIRLLFVRGLAIVVSSCKLR